MMQGRVANAAANPAVNAAFIAHMTPPPILPIPPPFSHYYTRESATLATSTIPVPQLRMITATTAAAAAAANNSNNTGTGTNNQPHPACLFHPYH